MAEMKILEQTIVDFDDAEKVRKIIKPAEKWGIKWYKDELQVQTASKLALALRDAFIAGGGSHEDAVNYAQIRILKLEGEL